MSFAQIGSQSGVPRPDLRRLQMRGVRSLL